MRTSTPVHKTSLPFNSKPKAWRVAGPKQCLRDLNILRIPSLKA